MFLPYSGMTTIWFSGVESLEQIVNILSTEGPIWNMVKKWSTGFREKEVKDYTILYMYTAQGKGG